MAMFDDKLSRARQLIEKRDQIDQELRILFGEAPQTRRARRRTEKDFASESKLGNGADGVSHAQE